MTSIYLGNSFFERNNFLHAYLYQYSIAINASEQLAIGGHQRQVST